MGGTYREVGEGALDFAREFIANGITRDKAKVIVGKLINGELHDKTDRRIKRCDYCNYYWRDDSKGNRKKTCCNDCKRGIKTLQRRQQRADKELLNPKPKKKQKFETLYVSWLEYPFWISEYEMLKRSWKHEVSYSPAKIEQISAAKQRDQLNGGKRKPKRVVPYNGNEAEQQKVFVRFADHKERTKPSEVETTTMSAEEIAKYFSDKYSDKHLELERHRATTQRKKLF